MNNNNNDDIDQFGADDFADNVGDDFVDAGYDPALDDDASFDADYSVDDDFSDEAWDESSVDAGDGGAPAKKQSMTNKIIIGAAVVIGAGVLVMNMMGGAKAPVANAPINNAPVANVADAGGAQTAMTAPAPLPAPLPVPSLANTDNGPDSGPDSGVGVPSIPSYNQDDMNAPAADMPDDQALPGGMLNDPSALAAMQRDVEDTYDSTDFETINVDRAGQELNAPAAAEQMETPVEVNNAPAMPDDSALSQNEGEANNVAGNSESGDASTISMPRVNDLLKPDTDKPAAQSAPNEIDSNVDGDGAVSVSAPAPAVVDQPNTEVLNRLDQIASRLDRLEDDLDIVRKESAAAVQEEVGDLRDSLKALEKKIGAQGTSNAGAARPVTETILTVTPTKPATAHKTQPVTWVLKGAQPGRAMVSSGRNGEMRSIEVGDTLPGIGRITAIAYDGGKWVVRGTQGQISQ